VNVRKISRIIVSSSAHHSPLLDIGLSNSSSSRSIFGYSHSGPAPGLKTSYTTFTMTRSPLQNSFTPAVAGTTAHMASPLPLQRTNTVCYVSDFSFLSDHLVSDAIPQRNPEQSFYSSLSDLELVDQLFLECPLLGSVCHVCLHHHHQPINVPTARAQAFLMDYPQRERAITHHAGLVRIGGCNRLQMQPGPTA
jgi:hypothetical protein